MTLPPPLPIDYAPAPKNPSHALAIWACIFISMIAFIGLRSFDDPAHKARAADDASSLQLEMAAKYLIGIRSFFPPSMMQDLGAATRSFDKLAAQSPQVKLRAIMVDGELHGTTAAQQTLTDFLRQDLPDSLRQDAQSLLRLYRDGPSALSPAEKVRLQSRHGWFAKLALARGLPPADPARAAVIASANRMFAFLLALIVVGCLALCSGVILLIVGIVLMALGKVPRAYRPVPKDAQSTIFLEVFALYLGGFALLSASFLFISRLPRVHIPSSAGVLILLVIPLPLAWPRIRGLSWAQTRQAFGLYAPRGVLREIAAGLTGYIAGMPILAVGTLITLALVNWTGNNATHPIVSEAAGGFWSILLMFLLAAVWAPITEELMFRGALFGHLRQRFGWCVSALTVALIFASLHPQGWVAIPVLAAVAVVLAGIREWRGSIIGSITAHALHNAIVVALLAVVVS